MRAAGPAPDVRLGPGYTPVWGFGADRMFLGPSPGEVSMQPGLWRERTRVTLRVAAAGPVVTDAEPTGPAAGGNA